MYGQVVTFWEDAEMFDVWVGDVNLTWLVLAGSMVLVFPFQLLLCFRVKSRLLRLAPLFFSLLLTGCALALSVWKANFGGGYANFEGVGYLILFLYGAYLLFWCAAGWGIWKLIIYCKNRRRRFEKH